jgi:hypothetical protein
VAFSNSLAEGGILLVQFEYLWVEFGFIYKKQYKKLMPLSTDDITDKRYLLLKR